jgi:hypothetical protein
VTPETRRKAEWGSSLLDGERTPWRAQSGGGGARPSCAGDLARPPCSVGQSPPSPSSKTGTRAARSHPPSHFAASDGLEEAGACARWPGSQLAEEMATHSSARQRQPLRLRRRRRLSLRWTERGRREDAGSGRSRGGAVRRWEIKAAAARHPSSRPWSREQLGPEGKFPNYFVRIESLRRKASAFSQQKKVMHSSKTELLNNIWISLLFLWEML